MKRVRTLDSWYKPVVATENPSVNNDQAAELGKMQVPEPEQNQSAPSQIEQATAFERDPSKRKQIWKFLPAQQKQNKALKFYISESISTCFERISI